MVKDYEFSKEDLQGIRQCNDSYGFAIVKQLISNDRVSALKDEVTRILEPKSDSVTTAFEVKFAEVSNVFLNYLDNDTFMAIPKYMNDHQPITLNRSAAIYKKPGAPVHAWHTDWEAPVHPYRMDGVLNNLGASSNWFYLNGTHPDRGGLALIPGSHKLGWEAPEGFEFTNHQKSFHRKGTPAVAYAHMDVPGSIAVYSDPGDLIIFADRTYHAVYAHNGNEIRLSCGMSFHKSGQPTGQKWELDEQSRKFLDEAPNAIRPYLLEYMGADVSWQSKA